MIVTQFITHACVKIRVRGLVVLCDPWVGPSCFNDGWRNLAPLSDVASSTLLEDVTHIFISHEHGDHFQPSFFLEHSREILDRKIQIVLHADFRAEVFEFLDSQNLEILKVGRNALALDEQVSLVILKFGFFDTCLAVMDHSTGKFVLNLNDCPVESAILLAWRLEMAGFPRKSCQEVWIQFSNASYKPEADGNKSQLRKNKVISGLANIFKSARFCLFASFIIFSGRFGSKIGRFDNDPSLLRGELGERVVLPTPWSFGSIQDDISFESARLFWNKRRSEVITNKRDPRLSLSLEELRAVLASFLNSGNSLYRSLLFIIGFRPRSFALGFVDHLEVFFLRRQGFLNYRVEAKCSSDVLADLNLYAGDLELCFSRSFGFDTLTVHGDFDVVTKGAQSTFFRLLAPLQLSHLGYCRSVSGLLRFALSPQRVGVAVKAMLRLNG